MKRLISITLVMLIALMFSGCVIVDAHYQYRYRHHGIVVRDYPPPPPPHSGYYIQPPPPVVIVKPAPSPYGPPHHYDRGPASGGRRELRR